MKYVSVSTGAPQPIMVADDKTGYPCEYADEVELLGKVRIIHDPLNPMRHGAKIFIEAERVNIIR